jgi:hypothetical protein
MNITTARKEVLNGNLIRLIAIDGDFSLSHYVLQIKRKGGFLENVQRFEPNDVNSAHAAFEWRAMALRRAEAIKNV